MISHNYSRIVCVLALTALLAGACAVGPADSAAEREQTQPPANGRLQASLEAPAELPHGAPVKLEFILTNNSASALYVLEWYTPLEGIAGEIFRIERDGEALPYEGILASRVAPSGDAYLRLEPGESASAEVDLATAYDFSRPGTYTISFISPRISHVARTEAELARALDELGPVRIPSNQITITVVSPPAPSGRKTPEEAADLIRAFLQGQKPDLIPGFQLDLEELPIQQLWESLNAQLFRVTAGPFDNETFLLRGVQVVQLGSAIGGRGLTSVLIGDLDENGTPELLFTYSHGPGVQQSRVGMYAPSYANDRAYDADFFYLGDLGLYGKGQHGAGVRVVEAHEAELRIEYLTPLGVLALQEQDGRVSLQLRIAEDLPDEFQRNLVIER